MLRIFEGITDVCTSVYKDTWFETWYAHSNAHLRSVESPQLLLLGLSPRRSLNPAGQFGVEFLLSLGFLKERGTHTYTGGVREHHPHTHHFCSTRGLAGSLDWPLWFIAAFLLGNKSLSRWMHRGKEMWEGFIKCKIKDSTLTAYALLNANA